MKPNHICKNQNCKKGVDGGRKHYYACDYCDASQSWRSMACSMECYLEYMKQIDEARNPKKKISLKELEIAKKKTFEELKDYSEDIRTIGLENTIDKINSEIDKENNTQSSYKKNSSKKKSSNGSKK